MRILLSQLVLRDNVVAGANVLVVASFALTYRVLDGRHRFLASVIAGRPDLLCQPETPPPT